MYASLMQRGWSLTFYRFSHSLISSPLVRALLSLFQEMTALAFHFERNTSPWSTFGSTPTYNVNLNLSGMPANLLIDLDDEHDDVTPLSLSLSHTHTQSSLIKH
mgnify:CR=1 FL=1